MLPATPLHHLLLRAVDRPLVMTSGNASEEPICIANDEAIERLSPIADVVLLHDRDVVARYDDSVVRVRTGARRAERAAARAIVRAEPDRAGRPGRADVGHGRAAARGVLPGRRAARVPVPARRRPRHGGVDGGLPRGVRPVPRGLPGRARARRARPAPGLHDDPVRGLTRAAASWPCSITTRTSPPRWPSSGSTARCSGSRSTGSGSATTARSGVASCSCATRPRTGGSGRLRQVVQPGGDAATRDPVRMALAHAHDAGVLGRAIDRLGAAPVARRRGRPSDRDRPRIAPRPAPQGACSTRWRRSPGSAARRASRVSRRCCWRSRSADRPRPPLPS